MDSFQIWERRQSLSEDVAVADSRAMWCNYLTVCRLCLILLLTPCFRHRKVLSAAVSRYESADQFKQIGERGDLYVVFLDSSRGFDVGLICKVLCVLNPGWTGG